jgi:hypothetical protein
MREHVAIVRRDVVGDLLVHAKSIETRFYRRRRAPLGRVNVGDKIHFKVSGGSIIGLARVVAVREFHGLTPRHIRQIQAKWGAGVRACGAYWRGRAKCRYGMLIWLSRLEAEPGALVVPRQYGNAWVVLGG